MENKFLITYTDGSQAVLMHWGIFGMEWGRRRYQNPDGSLTPAGKARYSKSKKYSKKDKTGDTQNRVKTLSDDELRALINRLDMEKRYRELTSKKEVTKIDDLINKLDKTARIAQSSAKIVTAIGQTQSGIKKIKGEKE